MSVYGRYKITTVAFQMKGMKTFFGPHAYVKHYADPLCAFIQNEQLARTSFAQNLNITPKTLTEVHYLNIPTTNPTTENASLNSK